MLLTRHNNKHRTSYQISNRRFIVYAFRVDEDLLEFIIKLAFPKAKDQFRHMAYSTEEHARISSIYRQHVSENISYIYISIFCTHASKSRCAREALLSNFPLALIIYDRLKICSLKVARLCARSRVRSYVILNKCARPEKKTYTKHTHTCPAYKTGMHRAQHRYASSVWVFAHSVCLLIAPTIIRID